MTTPQQEETVAAIRQHHPGVATVIREINGAVRVVIPPERGFRVLLGGDAVELETNRTIRREEIQRYGC